MLHFIMSLKKIIKKIFNILPVRLRCFLRSKFKGGKLTIGQGSYVHPSVHLLGKKNISIGSNSCISESSWLNVNCYIEGRYSIEVGNNCFIGKANFFSSGELIRIRDYTLTTINCKFIGSTHIVDNPEIPYLATGITTSDRIDIGVNCFIGAGATILGNVTIGHGSVIGANTLVLEDIPPFSMVLGSPGKIVRRYSFSKMQWIAVSAIEPSDLLMMPDETDYLKKLSTNYGIVNIPWIAAGRSMGNL